MSQPQNTLPTSEARTLYEQALRLLVKKGEISCSLIQRQLSVGYVRAREVFDRMEREGVIAVRGYVGKPVTDAQKHLKEVKDEV